MQNIRSKPVGKRIKLFKVLNSAGKPGNTILEDYDYTSVIKYVSPFATLLSTFWGNAVMEPVRG